MARALCLAIVLLVSGCGATNGPTSSSQQSGSGAPRTESVSQSPRTVSPITATAAVTPSLGPRCGDSRGSRPEPQYAFPHIAIPLGSDACQDVGPFTIPNIPYVSNDGSRVAFNATDYEEQGYVWYGDLTTDSVRIVYKAQQTASERAGIESVHVVGDQLVWLETLHAGPYVSNPAKEWLVMDMNVSTSSVKVLARGLAPAYGGSKLVNEIRFDGRQIAMAETIASGSQIELMDLTGTVRFTVSTADQPFDLALVSDGLLYSTGIANQIGAVGHMRLWHWAPGGSSEQIGTDVFQINAEQSLSAWVADPLSSQNTTGNFQAPRLYAATAPFTKAQPISPVDSATGTKGIDGMSCGSGTVAWWEQENWNDAWQDVLTIWQPGWSSPVQVDTEGNESYRVSVGGGWLVWEEGFGRDQEPLLERIRGVPLSVLTSQHKGA
jgi:hypothetical protein